MSNDKQVSGWETLEYKDHVIEIWSEKTGYNTIWCGKLMLKIDGALIHKGSDYMSKKSVIAALKRSVDMRLLHKGKRNKKITDSDRLSFILQNRGFLFEYANPSSYPDQSDILKDIDTRILHSRSIEDGY